MQCAAARSAPFLLEDPGAFNEPWEAVQHYNRAPNRGPLPEQNCSENNGNIFNLEGYVPSLATPEEIRDAFDKAFDFRGDLTITLKTGDKIDGYVFDRRAESADLSQCLVRIFPRNSAEKMSIRYSDIAALAFTGKDSAAGKSFEAWVKK